MEKNQIEKELEIYRKHMAALSEEIASLYTSPEEIAKNPEPSVENDEMQGQMSELKNCIGELCGVLKNMQAQQNLPNMQFQAIPGMIVSPSLPYLKTPDITPVMPARMLNNQNNGDSTR